MAITNGFLVVKRFEALFPQFVEKLKLDRAIYALPVRGTRPDQMRIKYRGLDRDPLSAYAKGLLAQTRMLELKARFPDWSDEFLDDFLPTFEEASDVLQWAEQEAPGIYEIIWTRIAGVPEGFPPGFVRLGFEPTYFRSDHFSAICDCMCFPRWHGTDPEGTLFLKYFERLNASGLFDEPSLASEFLAYYLSFDWTEKGDYEIAEVWGAGPSPEAFASTSRSSE